MSQRALGLYLHIPFCRHRCDYCAFATWTDRGHLAERYLRACRQQITETVDPDARIETVFVGGGTPTLVDPEALMQVLGAIPLGDGAEVTVECNPDDVTSRMLAIYRDGGVTRLSIGVQSMVPHVLEALGRTHDPRNVRVAAEAAHEAGLPFNVDLIYGARGESQADWEVTLREATALDPVHVSAYGLTVEAGTPLARQVERHPDDDDQADKYLLATDFLANEGFEWYEISNWAKPGHQCRHNGLYWSGGEYFAIGCAAHGHLGGRRFWNVRTPDRFVDCVERGATVEAGSEQLDPDARALEHAQLALRTARGVPVDAFDPDDLTTDLVGLVERTTTEGAERLVLTVRGRLLANEVALRLR